MNKKTVKVLKETYLDCIMLFNESTIDQADAVDIMISCRNLLRYYMVMDKADAWLEKNPMPDEVWRVFAESTILF